MLPLGCPLQGEDAELKELDGVRAETLSMKESIACSALVKREDCPSFTPRMVPGICYSTSVDVLHKYPCQATSVVFSEWIAYTFASLSLRSYISRMQSPRWSLINL